MEDKENVFNDFFDSLASSSNADSVSTVQTPKEMLVDPESPPPSPCGIKEYEINVASFEAIVKTCKESLQDLPLKGQEDYNRLKASFVLNRTQFKEDMTPNELSRQIFLVQTMKDQTIEMMAESHSNFLIRKRYLEVLLTTFNSISQQKTADKRKSDAQMRLFEFVKGCSDAEAFYVQCKYYFDNLESQHKTISRRITCMQAQMNIGEIPTAGDGPGIELADDTSPGESDWTRK